MAEESVVSIVRPRLATERRLREQRQGASSSGKSGSGISLQRFSQAVAIALGPTRDLLGLLVG